uniref:Reverse transcriptase domain-containing protein n=1 Tax=Mesocestoides corti TaxID=53468 RepID=A0A5K3F1M3_MESCO
MQPRSYKHRSSKKYAFKNQDGSMLQEVIRLLVQEADALERLKREEADNAKYVPTIQNIIAPDGYLPNSVVRQRIALRLSKVFREKHKLPRYLSSNTSILSAPPPFPEHIKKSLVIGVQLKKVTDEIKQEAKRFKQMASYYESKKMSRLLEEAVERVEGETAKLRHVNTMARKRSAYRINRKLAMLKLRKELTAYARQQIHENQRKKAREEARMSRRPIRPTKKPVKRLSDNEFNEMTIKLTEKFGSDQKFYNVMNRVFGDPPDESARKKITSILGSHAQFVQFLNFFKKPSTLLPYLAYIFGGIKRIFRFIDRALLGNLWSIYKIAQAIGFDFKATLKFVLSAEETISAACACLTTKTCNFHYVEGYINLLLKNDWSEADLLELANGRYVETLKPGDKPNRNPLLSVPTKMSEKSFLRFYKALKEFDYKYFQTIGNIQYEQSSYKNLLKRKDGRESSAQFTEVLKAIEAEENRPILRPSPATYRKLACVMLEVTQESGMPEFLAKYFTHLASKHVIIMSSAILLEVRNQCTSAEVLSFQMNRFIKVFADTCFHVNRIIEDRLSKDAVVNLLLNVAKGDPDECYRFRTLLDTNLAAFLAKVLQRLHGKVVNGIMHYAFLSSHSGELEDLLKESLATNENSPSKPLIQTWIILTKLAFSMAREINVSQHIPELQKILRQTNFFIEAGYKGILNVPPPPPEVNQGHRLRSIYMPIKAQVPTARATKKVAQRRKQRTGTQQRRGPYRQRAVRNYQLAASYTSEPSVRYHESEDSEEQEFFEKEIEIFSALKIGFRLDLDDFEEDSDDSLLTPSLAGAVNFEKKHFLEGDSAFESLTSQIRKVYHDKISRQKIEPALMEHVDEGWSALVELQAVKQLIGSKDWKPPPDLQIKPNVVHSLDDFVLEGTGLLLKPSASDLSENLFVPESSSLSPLSTDSSEKTVEVKLIIEESKETKQEAYKKSIDAIIKKTFLPKMKTVSDKLYIRKKAELVRVLQATHKYSKESIEKIVNGLFKVGLMGVTHDRLSQLIVKALQMDKGLQENKESEDDSSNILRLHQAQRMDDLIDWVELVDAGPDPHTLIETPLSVIPALSESSSSSEWVAAPRYQPKLPPVSPKPSLVEQPVVDKPKQPRKVIPITPSSQGSTEITQKESDLEPPTGESLVETPDSTMSDLVGEWKTSRHRESNEDLRSVLLTSSFGTWAYSTSTATPSSELTDRVLTDENADINYRRPPRKLLRASSVHISPFEVTDHIANVLEAITDLGQESLVIIRGTLDFLADKGAKLDSLDVVFEKLNTENSIFWNDETSGFQLMNTFQDVVLATASLMLEYLDDEKSTRLFEQTTKEVSTLLQKLAQIGTIALSDDDVERLYDSLAMLKSGSMMLRDVFKSKGPSGKPLIGNAQRWFRPLDLKKLFQSPAMMAYGLRDSVGSNRLYLPRIRTSSKSMHGSGKRSAVIIAKTFLPLLPSDVVEATQKIPQEKRFTFIVEAMDIRLQRRLRMAKRDPGGKNNRDILKLMTTVLQQSEKVQHRVNRRLNALGIQGVADKPRAVAEISSIIRIVNRPSFIKPHEWSRLTGGAGLASMRLGNTTLCHRGENKALGPLIRADRTSELSHKMVINYDIAHLFNRHSLARFTELCGGK